MLTSYTHCCRQQAEANIGAVQAAADTAAAVTTPRNRRTTAETATQYMLGDLDCEPLDAYAHARQSQEAESLARASIDTRPTEDDPAGLYQDAPAGVYAKSAPPGLHGSAFTGLIQAQSEPLKAFDRGRKESEGMIDHPMPDVRYSELEGTITAAEDEEMQRQAFDTALRGGDRPHDQQAQCWQAAKQHQQPSLGAVQAHPVASISVSVMAGATEVLPHGQLSSQAGFGLESRADSPSAWHGIPGGRTAAESENGTGLNMRRVQLVGQTQASQRIRSPLQSIHEDHEIGPRSARTSATGRQKRISIAG